MIKKLEHSMTFSLDFMQNDTNKIFTDKINEIINYINKKESEENDE